MVMRIKPVAVSQKDEANIWCGWWYDGNSVQRPFLELLCRGLWAKTLDVPERVKPRLASTTDHGSPPLSELCLLCILF